LKRFPPPRLLQGGTQDTRSLDFGLFTKYLIDIRGTTMATAVATERLEASVLRTPIKAYDIDWLAPFALIVAVEMMLAGTVELSVTYSLLALTGASVLAIGWLLLWVVTSIRNRLEHPATALANIIWANRSRLLCAVIGIQFAAFGISAFSILKAQIPVFVPYYADHALADFDLWLFGQDAWLWSAQLFGTLITPISIVYGAWLMTQFIAFSAVLVSRPTHLKSQAVIAYGLMWLLLGIILAYGCSSVGPIFFDRIYGGQRFADLDDFLRSALGVTRIADLLWARQINGDTLVGSGISAMPSLHVAGTVWLALIIRRSWPRLAVVGWAYFAVIYLGSIMLGWHYATDGIVGVLGMLVIWKFAGKIMHWRQWIRSISTPNPNAGDPSPDPA
jgi:hypothetical protein